MQESVGTNHVERDDPRLYTAAEFCQRVAAFQRAVLIGFAVFFAGMFGIYAVFGIIDQYLGPQREWTPLRVVVCIGLILLFLTQFLMLGGLILGLEQIKRRDRVTCERCGKHLDVGELNFAIAIHCCPYCQNALFQEWNASPVVTANPESVDSVKGEFTLADIGEAEKKQMRAFGICLAKAAAAATVVLCITAAAVWMWYDLLLTRFGELAPHAANLIRLVSAFVVLGIGLFWTLCRTPGGFPKCGGCGRRIDASRYTHATGNCGTCGRRVIRDAPVLRFEANDAGEGLLERAEFTSRVNRYWKLSFWWCASIVGIGGLIWFRLVFWWFGIQMRDQPKIIEVVAFLSGLGILFLVFEWFEQRVPRPRCPNCQQPLESRLALVQTTGNCCHCGWRVLKITESVDPP